ncbi:hypothetical protein LEMLEM_LOCUS95 [Lemmus lemmus]
MVEGTWKGTVPPGADLNTMFRGMLAVDEGFTWRGLEKGQDAAVYQGQRSVLRGHRPPGYLTGSPISCLSSDTAD